MNDRIEKFLRRHRVMTLASVDSKGVWCANIFYVYHDGELIFFSSCETRHVAAARTNPAVSCSVALESRLVARLQGVQIEGQFAEAAPEIYRKIFLKRFPFAAAWNEQLWRVTIISAKFTDNTLGFGTKLYWSKQ